MSYALLTEHMGMDGRIVNDIIPLFFTPGQGTLNAAALGGEG